MIVRVDRRIVQRGTSPKTGEYAAVVVRDTVDEDDVPREVEMLTWAAPAWIETVVQERTVTATDWHDLDVVRAEPGDGSRR